MFYNELLAYYEKNIAPSGKYAEYTIRARIGSPVVVTVDLEGNPLDVSSERGNGEMFSNPCTPESMVRTNPPHKFPHPFFDYAKVIFGIDNDGEIRWKGAEPDANGVNGVYMKNLSEFNAEAGLPETKAIERFFGNADGVERLRRFVMAEGLKDSFVLFKLVDPDSDAADAELWNNRDVISAWSERMKKKNASSSVVCQFTGGTGPACRNSPKITYFGSTIFTRNFDRVRGDRFVNSNPANAPEYVYGTISKISAAFNELARNPKRSFGSPDGDKTIVFSIDDDNEDIDFVCAAGDEAADVDVASESVVEAVRTEKYDPETISSGGDVYMLTFRKNGKTLTVSNIDVIPAGTLHENIDFWKKNFLYAGWNAGLKRYAPKTRSVTSVVNCVVDESKSKSKRARIRNVLLNCMIRGKAVPDSVTEELIKSARRVWRSNLSGDKRKAEYELENIENCVMSIKNYNDKIGKKEEPAEMNRDFLLGKLYQAMFELEKSYRSGTSSSVNYVYDHLGRFLKNPNETVKKFETNKKYIMRYGRKKRRFELGAMDGILAEISEKGMDFSAPVGDMAAFALGKRAFKVELSERFAAFEEKKRGNAEEPPRDDD